MNDEILKRVRFLEDKIDFNTFLLAKMAVDLKCIDIPCDAIQDYIASHRHYYNHFRKFPDIVNPRGFTEKIQKRKILERNILFPQYADKFEAKKLVADKVGDKYVIPLLYVTNVPEQIPFSSLPEEYVIKANHGCGYNIICTPQNVQVDDKVYTKSEIGNDKIVTLCNRWLNSVYGLGSGEWLYRAIKPVIFVEKLVRDEDGNIPKDFRFHCFHGKVHMIQVDRTLGNHEVVQAFYTPEWERINLCYRKMNPEEIERPKVLEEMLSVAERLSNEFSYVRVDLYLCGDNVYFGELTFYPVAGNIPFVPKEYDEMLGELWKE